LHGIVSYISVRDSAAKKQSKSKMRIKIRIGSGIATLFVSAVQVAR